jgi:site-specific DNA recombinase
MCYGVGMSTRAVIYARVSSDPRGIGRSTREQVADCEAIADREGWTVVETFVDNDRSASRFANGDRPAYKNLVRFLQDGHADVLVTWEASRTQRDLDAYVKLRDLCRDAGVLWCYSGRTYDLDRTDDAFTTGLDALLAEREASQTRDRVLRSVKANAAAGRPHGKRVFGYRRIYDERTGELVSQIVDDDQAAVVREAARRVLSGETPNAVAQDFNARKIATPAGGKGWDLTQIKRLCTNPTYIAKRVHKGKVVAEATWPPILDEATFYALTTKLNDPKRRTQRDSAVRHLLSGIAICGVCGGRIRVQKNRGFLAYLCVDGFHVSRREDYVDEFVVGVTVGRLSQPDVLELLAHDDDADVQAARAEAAELRARLDGFYDAAAGGELTPAALARIEAKLLPAIEQADKRGRSAAVSPALVEAAGPDIAGRWETLPLTARREIIDALMVVKIMPTGQGRRTFDPSAIAIEWKATA